MVVSAHVTLAELFGDVDALRGLSEGGQRVDAAVALRRARRVMWRSGGPCGSGGRRFASRDDLIQACRMARLLIVDDNDTMREGMAVTLKKSGHDVHAFRSAADALAAYKKSAFDVCVTDLKMEGMDGIEVVKALKAHDDKVVAMVVTAFGTIETAVQAMQSGAANFITKPFPPEELRAKVEGLLEAALERAGPGGEAHRPHRGARARREGAQGQHGGRRQRADSEAARAGEEGRGQRGHRHHSRRVGHRQRARRPHAARAVSARERVRSSPRTARRWPRRCSRASFLATSAARSPAR